MTQLFIYYLAPIMFGSLIFFLMLGLPVAFTLSATGLIFGFIGIELGLFSPNFLQALPERVFGIMSNETLLAIPFFTFMGLILERSRMAEDLLDTMGQLFGPIRGGLAYATIFVGALLAATTGVVSAAVISMGLISLPIMMRYGYDYKLATGTIMASGTLAQIIPPSLVLIVLADVLGKSVGDFYAGAIVPGLMLTALYALYVLVVTLIDPKAAPPLPREARTLGDGVASLMFMIAFILAVSIGATLWFATQVEQGPEIFGAAVGILLGYLVTVFSERSGMKFLSHLAAKVITVLMPPLALIFLVLGTIFIGLATPTEGGAMGAFGALILAWMNGRLKFGIVKEAGEATLKLATFVMFVLIGARVFALTFYGIDGHIWIKNMMLSLPGGATGFIFFVNVMVFILGCFIDFFEIAFILMPLLVAPAQALGIDIVWFGVLMAMNMQTSFLTPPFGFALFYLRSVAPRLAYLDKVTGRKVEGVPTTTLYRGVVPFISLQLAMVVVVFMFPILVTHYQRSQTQLAPTEVQRQLDNLIVPGPLDDPPPPPFGAPPATPTR